MPASAIARCLVARLPTGTAPTLPSSIVPCRPLERRGHNQSMTESTRPTNPGNSIEELIAAYAVVGARRTSYDTMMWQVPALAMAAQAFLLTIALGSDVARAARVIAGALAALLAVLSAQLMMKHRALEVVDSRIAEEIERQMGLDRWLDFHPHAAAGTRLGGHKPWWIRLSSYRLWLTGLAVFAATDLAVAVLAVAGSSLAQG